MIEIISDHKPTNADRIRDLNDEKLAEIIMCPYDTEPDLCNKKAAMTVVLNGFSNRKNEVVNE